MKAIVQMIIVCEKCGERVGFFGVWDGVSPLWLMTCPCGQDFGHLSPAQIQAMIAAREAEKAKEGKQQ